LSSASDDIARVGWKSLQCENFQSTLDLQKFQAYPIFMQGTPKLIKMQEKHFNLIYIKFYLNKIYYIIKYIMMHQNQIFSNFKIDFNLSYMWFCTFDHKIISFNLILFFLNENY